MRCSRSLLSAAVVMATALTIAADEPVSTSAQTVRSTTGSATRPQPRPFGSPPQPLPRPTPVTRTVADRDPDTPPLAGVKSIPTPPPGGYGIVSSADGAGGIFRDTDSQAEAWIGTDGYGVRAWGSNAGARFSSSNPGSNVWLAKGDTGIQTYGSQRGAILEGDVLGVDAAGFVAGGLFLDLDGTGWAYVGVDDVGIYATGTEAAGSFSASGASGWALVAEGNRGISAGGSHSGAYFEDSDATSYTVVAYGNRGIEAHGNDMGGYFEDLDGTGSAHVGFSNRGVQATGNEMGGYFSDSDSTGYMRAGFGNRGLEAYGSEMGGYFEDSDGSGYSILATGDRGVEAGGTEMGGHFEDTDGSGFAYLGWGNTGVFGRGSVAGGVFNDGDDSGYAWAGWGDRGLVAGGTEMGGRFEDTDSSIWANVATDTYKIDGNGTVNFVQNHPYDPASVVVYTAPEGDEVATYTRGTATLSGGEARVPLGETFQWVTNPDIGLTAYAMPVGHWCDLYVAEKGTEEIVVRSRDGSDCAFDFLVYGLRIGFEESTVVQEKTREAYIPSMKSHRDRAARSPEFARHTALSHWTAVRKALGDEEPLDLSRAHALRDLIQEYDPEVHGPLGAHRRTERTVAGESRDNETAGSGGSSVESPADRPSTDRRAVGQFARMSGSDPDRDVYARSFRPSAADLASLLEVSESVEPGDVLAIDPERPGLMRRADTAEDPTVVGVVAASPGVVLGASGTGADAEAAVAFAGVTSCKVDAEYGPVYPGDLLVTSPTPGHAMRADVPLPGTVLGKALEELTTGSGVIRVLVMLR